jgi:glycosyltransferase involved in cell wall biosynthesis
MRIVYVTYDGLEDPLGQSQVRPYVDGLALLGHRFEIVSFEKPGVRLRLREPVADGIRWTALRYHKRFTVPATAIDMLQGLGTTAMTSLMSRADLIHVRSYVAATLVLPWAIAARVPVLFDMRGFWPDEKADGGGWTRASWMYRSAKAVERVLLRRAAAIVVLTHSMRDYQRNEYPQRSRIRAPIHVIPTCADLTRFTPTGEKDSELAPAIGAARVLAYVGSLGTYYMAGTLAQFYLAWRSAVRASDGPGVETRFLVLSRSDPATIASVMGASGVAGELVHRSVRHDRVPALLRWAEAGLCFRSPGFAAIGCAPTKIGEMLACGMPVAANDVGDAGQMFGDTSAGTVVRDFSEPGLREAADRLARVARRPEVRREARLLAERWFRLEDGVAAFDDIYRNIRVRPPAPGATAPAGSPEGHSGAS